ncbi:MAG: NADH-quinone oxidoreductase subunit N [Armatimonadota bacterium]
MKTPTVDWATISPEVVLSVFAMVVLLMGTTIKKTYRNVLLTIVSAIGVLSTAYLTIRLWTKEYSPGFDDTFNLDQFAIAMTVIILIATLIAVLMAHPYMTRKNSDVPEYYALLLLSSVGGLVMVSSTNLMVIFIGLEILSISMYVLAGLNRTEPKSEEAALKYFLLGAFASGFLIYGIAMLYGACGTVDLHLLRGVMNGPMADPGYRGLLFMAGCAFVLVGLGFKAALVPFQMWTPDVYEGAPTSAAAYLASAAKACAFAVLFRFVLATIGFGVASQVILGILAILALITMTVGNVVALRQTSIKRMLAYSSIAHAGYLTVGVAAAQSAAQLSAPAILFYLGAYTLMTMGAFAVASMLFHEGQETSEITDLAGLYKRNAALAAAMSIFMFSLAGIPGTAGFMGKFMLFQSALSVPGIGLVMAITLAINSVISAYYYLRVIVTMYFQESDRPAFKAAGFGVSLAVVICVVGTIFFGLYPIPIDYLQEIGRKIATSTTAF